MPQPLRPQSQPAPAASVNAPAFAALLAPFEAMPEEKREVLRNVLQIYVSKDSGKHTELKKKKTEALLRRDAARTHSWCTSLAHDLIEHHKQAATKAVLTPLESRPTSAFAKLTDVIDREAFLDKNLQIASIGRARDSAHAFDNLSQGAKEQLPLCLRLAVAQKLAADEPHVLILDDVLFNTDPVRQERILDFLGTQADRLQILILTCHPDRYRGIGESLTLK